MLLFPDDYYRFETKEHEGKSNDISKYMIDVWVQQSLDYLKEHPEEQRYSIATGNTKVVVLRYDSEIQIMVMKDYWEKNTYS